MLTSWGNVLTWMDPVCCFSGTTPLVSGFLGVVVCKKSFGLYTWQPNKSQGLLALYCVGNHIFCCLGRRFLKVQPGASGETGVLIWSRCASLVIGGIVCRLLFFEEASNLQEKLLHSPTHTAQLWHPCCYSYADVMGSSDWQFDEGRGEWMHDLLNAHLLPSPFWTQLWPHCMALHHSQYFSANLRPCTRDQAVTVPHMDTLSWRKWLLDTSQVSDRTF